MKIKTADQDRLVHIKESAEYIEEFTKGISYEQYIKDYKLRLAILKLLEIIAEASSGITRDTTKNFAGPEGKILNNIRSILMNDFSGIDYDIIWKSVKSQIPQLKNMIAEVIDKQE